jgi:hypothetical protein
MNPGVPSLSWNGMYRHRNLLIHFWCHEHEHLIHVRLRSAFGPTHPRNTMVTHRWSIKHEMGSVPSEKERLRQRSYSQACNWDDPYVTMDTVTYLVRLRNSSLMSCILTSLSCHSRASRTIASLRQTIQTSNSRVRRAPWKALYVQDAREGVYIL